MMRSLFVWNLWLAFILVPVKVGAQEFIPPTPKDLDKIRITLMTVGLGDELAGRFGHTMVRVRDEANRIDYLANWGLFNFSDPMFIPKFFRGILMYRLGFSGYQSTIRYYRDVERRPMVEDDLNFTNLQKSKLIDKIIWNAKPANATFPYQYFYNNCSTIPRDYFDEVLHGVIKRHFGDAKAGLTFRDYVRSNLYQNPMVGWPIDVIFNGDTDRQITKWEEMFYPPKLREYLASLNKVSDDGYENPGQPLLTNHRVLVDLPEPEAQALSGFILNLLVVGVPLAFLAGFGVLSRHHFGQGAAKMSFAAKGWQPRLFGLVCVWWGMTAGFFGLTHTLAWMCSIHTDLHRNLNILLFFPVDFLVLAPAFRLLISGNALALFPKWLSPRWLTKKYWIWWCYLHLALIPVYAACSLSGLFVQNTWHVLIYMVPIAVLFYAVFLRFLSQSSQSIQT